MGYALGSKSMDTAAPFRPSFWIWVLGNIYISGNTQILPLQSQKGTKPS